MEQTISHILKKLTLPYVTVLFSLVALMVYGNALFNDFVSDDKTYIVNNQQIHNINLAVSFGMNNFDIGGQYHALQALYFSLLYAMFGNTPFFYHIVQILLHIACTTLLYLLFRKFLHPGISLFLALVFLIHPIQVESVSYIAQTASPLFFLLGIASLHLLIRKKISCRKLTFAFLLLLLSLLEKETGILFLFMILLYCLLFARNNLKKFSIGSFLVIAVYAFFRFAIGHVGFEKRLIFPIAQLSLPERLLNVPAIIFYYLKTFFFPMELSHMQQWVVTSVNFPAFFLPLFIDISFFLLISLAGVYLFKRNKHDLKPYIFFFAWFLIGILFHVNIFPLDATVADRWFYFPLAGLLGIFGLLYQNLVKKLPYYIQFSLVISFLILLAFAMRTIVRNSDWQNNIKLFTHDIQVNDNFMLESNLGTEYGILGDNDKAIEHLQKSVALKPDDEDDLYDLALTYLKIGKIQQAKTYLEKAINANNYYVYSPHKHAVDTYMGYATVLVFYDDSNSAVPFLHEALSDYPDISGLWYLLALAEYKQQNAPGALDAAEKAYQLDPSEQNKYVYSNIQHGSSFSIIINGKTFIFNPQTNIKPNTQALPSGWKQFTNVSMRLTFIYPETLRLVQYNPQFVSLSSPLFPDSDMEDKLYIYSTEISNQARIPFPVSGQLIQSKPLQIYGFQAVLETYTNTAEQTQVILMKNEQQFIAIRLPKQANFGMDVVNQIIQSITFLQ